MGRTVLITGTNRGIGKAILERFAKEDSVTILAHARKESEDFLRDIENLKSENPSIEVVPVYFDLKNSEEMKVALKETLSVHKKSKAFLMTDMDQVRESFDVNFFAQTEITQIVCRAMIRNRKGSIINLASIAAFTGIEGQFEYVSGKSAIVGMTKKLSKELAAYGIRVNAVAPGMINTEMIMQMEDSMREGLKERLVARRMGEPSEIANTVYFLGSEEASYISGQTLIVDGGGYRD